MSLPLHLAAKNQLELLQTVCEVQLGLFTIDQSRRNDEKTDISWKTYAYCRDLCTFQLAHFHFPKTFAPISITSTSLIKPNFSPRDVVFNILPLFLVGECLLWRNWFWLFGSHSDIKYLLSALLDSACSKWSVKCSILSLVPNYQSKSSLGDVRVQFH